MSIQVAGGFGGSGGGSFGLDISVVSQLPSAVQEGAVVLHVTVQGQNPGVNPALLAAAVERHLPALKPDFVRVRRTALVDGNGQLFR